MIWSADLDPAILPVAVSSGVGDAADSVVLRDLAPWLTIATDIGGGEHVLLSDGWQHIRLDIVEGRLGGRDMVSFHYRLGGIVTAEGLVPPLRRFLALCRQRSFPTALFPVDPRMDRGLDVLRVHDALADGASQREIASVFFGEERVAADWSGPSDSLRSRVRRLVSDARAMAGGGYRWLLRRSGKEHG
ncbi:DUF2285 domain-containing protein [Novosphingobium rosa]|uniref:DUF2285 domain-containing protein n=1 Tax=Novosphingobium rosa TaxID=76978 RepID=UPI00082E1873|nr:DUF2285 domain-containing protein [Novosphingobium rosa]